MNKLPSIKIWASGMLGLLLGLLACASTNSPILRNDVTTKLPAESCGDSGKSVVWWPVFSDDGDLENIKQHLCRDAFITKRYDGTPSIQLASFKTREKAKAFADQVSGVVGRPTYDSKDGTEQQTATSDTENNEANTKQQSAIPNTGYYNGYTEYQTVKPNPEPMRDGHHFDRDSAGECTTYANGCND